MGKRNNKLILTSVILRPVNKEGICVREQFGSLTATRPLQSINHVTDGQLMDGGGGGLFCPYTKNKFRYMAGEEGESGIFPPL